ncbi:MAG: SRPBCC domain-containing protein [Ignavibacterium album]|uniref:SRPBCC domain-containing protein n=1 Tax=Ignavibacterium album TaxID=591197 RepID=UPI0026F13E62|nr:SRPBCC domain-containing protein [Ignavibacterium album]MCX8104838.1 SRPBCC domain-containing protein [Ignavibacterium album]
MESNKIKVEATIKASVKKVWEYFTKPEHIVNWNFASDDWYCPKAVNELKPDSKFSWRMESKDGSAGFDFEGIYNEVQEYKKIKYTLGDNREVEIIFNSEDNSTYISETFDAENFHTHELQKTGWQAILNNFKKYVELHNKLMTLEFSIEINATVDVVFNKMLGLENIMTYELWTSEFNPTSTYEGTWEKGSEIKFIGTESTWKKGGMVSRIAENIPNKLISIQHIGILDGDKIITDGPEVELWKGAFENYFFEDKNGSTLLTVNTETSEEYKDYFSQTWPKALLKLKSLCEV